MRGPYLTSGALGDANIATDADLVTDASIETLDQTQPSHEDSSDDVNDESGGTTNGDSAVVEEDPSFEIAADGTVEETSFGPFDPILLDSEADDIVGSQLEDGGDNALGDDWMHNLAEDWMVDDIVLERIEHIVVEETADGDMMPVLNDAVSEPATSVAVMVDNPLNDLIRSVLDNAFAGGATSEAVVLVEGVYHLVGSVLVEALARGGAYEVLVLDDDMDDLMWSKLYDALYGRTVSAPVNVGEFLDGLMASVLHNAFFGPDASKAVSSLSKNADISGLVVEDYIQKVSKLYTKFKEARFPTSDDTAIGEELRLELTSDTVGGSDPSSAFVQELPFIITDERVDGGIRLGAFGPVIPVYAVDKAATKTIFFDNAVTDLVLSLAKDALTGEASSAPMLDDGVDDLMWAKLHHSTSITGRAASGDTDLGDALDYTLTNVLHRAFFGPVATDGIASLAKYTDDREMMVKDYVRAVSKVYDKFKEVRY